MEDETIPICHDLDAEGEKIVEVTFDSKGTLWININGLARVRVHGCNSIAVRYNEQLLAQMKK